MDFVNEGKLEEEKQRRQAEWDRVRKPEDPVGEWHHLEVKTRLNNHKNSKFTFIPEAPDEYFDNRSLYDRLREQHEKKKSEFEGQYSLSKS